MPLGSYGRGFVYVGVVVGALFLIVDLTQLFAGLRREPKVWVECNEVLIGYQCTLTHLEGGAPVQVCWQVAGRCFNGADTLASVCQEVQPESKVTTIVPFTEIRNMDRCDGTRQLAIQQLVIHPVQPR